MQHLRYQPVSRAMRAAGMLAAVLAVGAPGSAWAHEGHAALPSTGATVEGEHLFLSDGARKGVGLETATVTLQDLHRVLRVRANLELPWDGQAMVTTLIPGRVRAILVKPGETVHAGQELARIESLELERLQLVVLQASEELALAERLVEQRRTLAESGAIPGKSLQESESELRQKRVQLAIVQRKLAALGVSEDTLWQVRTSEEPISFISVTAPIPGVVMHSDVRVGQFIDTERHLFHIVDRSTVHVVGEVLEADAWQVEPGQSVQVTFPALLGNTFTGTIERHRLTVDSRKRTVEIVMRLDNQEGWLRPGMSGRMEITVHQAKEAIVCPTAALIDMPGRTFVLLRRGEGKYQRREVEVGLRTPERVEIRNGLFPGDRVVVTGTKLLASIFHTDTPISPSSTSARSPTVNRQASPSVSDISADIPVTQAVVELPTSHKTFATPVIEGRVARIHVQPGERVEAGQLLAELDSLELRNLQLELLETQEKLRRITDVIQWVEPLAGSGSYPASQLWERQTERKTLQYTLQNIERTLATVGLAPQAIERLRRIDLSQSDVDVVFATVPVRAPAAGRVADFEFVLGQVVHADDALFEVQNLSTVWIEGYVFEQHAEHVQVGQAAAIRFAAHPDLELTGKVIRTAPALISSARVLPVWIEVDNPHEKLREGMVAEIKFVSQSRSGQIATVPVPQE
jgi:membrane fusion protein, heavy metal efflux system